MSQCIQTASTWTSRLETIDLNWTNHADVGVSSKKKVVLSGFYICNVLDLNIIKSIFCFNVIKQYIYNFFLTGHLVEYSATLYLCVCWNSGVSFHSLGPKGQRSSATECSYHQPPDPDGYHPALISTWHTQTHTHTHTHTLHVFKSDRMIWIT